MAAMTASTLTGRVADLQLRGANGPLRARVCWPGRARDEDAAPPLMLAFKTRGDDADGLCRALAEAAGVVVLATGWRFDANEPSSSAFYEARAVLEWAADHGGELDADPARLIVAGEGPGAALAAGVALHARDDWWPAIARQVLVHPVLDVWQASVPYVGSLRTAPVGGGAPATIVTRTSARCGGRQYAARLRLAGVDVEELRHDDADDPALLAELVETLRRL